MRISDWSSDVCSSDLVSLTRPRQLIMENSTVTKPAFAALLCIGLSAAAAPALAQEQAAPAQEPAASTAAPAPTPAQPSTEAPAGKMTPEQIAALNQAVADFTAGQQLQQARSEERRVGKECV